MENNNNNENSPKRLALRLGFERYAQILALYSAYGDITPLSSNEYYHIMTTIDRELSRIAHNKTSAKAVEVPPRATFSRSFNLLDQRNVALLNGYQFCNNDTPQGITHANNQDLSAIVQTRNLDQNLTLAPNVPQNDTAPEVSDFINTYAEKPFQNTGELTIVPPTPFSGHRAEELLPPSRFPSYCSSHAQNEQNFLQLDNKQIRNGTEGSQITMLPNSYQNNAALAHSLPSQQTAQVLPPQTRFSKQFYVSGEEEPGMDKLKGSHSSMGVHGHSKPTLSPNSHHQNTAPELSDIVNPYPALTFLDREEPTWFLHNPPSQPAVTAPPPSPSFLSCFYLSDENEPNVDPLHGSEVGNNTKPPEKPPDVEVEETLDYVRAIEEAPKPAIPPTFHQQDCTTKGQNIISPIASPLLQNRDEAIEENEEEGFNIYQFPSTLPFLFEDELPGYVLPDNEEVQNTCFPTADAYISEKEAEVLDATKGPESEDNIIEVQIGSKYSRYKGKDSGRSGFALYFGDNHACNMSILLKGDMSSPFMVQLTALVKALRLIKDGEGTKSGMTFVIKCSSNVSYFPYIFI